jgi:DNA polymerase-3 subunit delta'
VPVLRDILGQERAVGQLRRALAGNKLPHAMLFAGPNGVGKATTARALARALNCAIAPGEGCDGECAACSKIGGGIHPDVITVLPGGAGDVIGIPEVRQLTEKLAFAPHEGAARVVILEDADRLTAQAANAFLKTLEEPPARTHFVLVTGAPDRMLVTIRSRCQHVRFAPLDAGAVAAILVAGGVDAARATSVARLAGGSAASAAELATGDALERRRDRARSVREAVRAGTWRAATAAASDLAQAKEDLVPTLSLLALWYRDAAALAAGVSAERLVHQGDLAELQGDAAIGPALLARRAAAVLDAQTAIQGYANAQLALENMMLTLREDLRS